MLTHSVDLSQPKPNAFSSLIEILAMTQLALIKLLDTPTVKRATKSFFDQLDFIAKNQMADKVEQDLNEFIVKITVGGHTKYSHDFYSRTKQLSHIYINLKNIYFNFHKYDKDESKSESLSGLDTHFAELMQLILNETSLKTTALKSTIDNLIDLSWEKFNKILKVSQKIIAPVKKESPEEDLAISKAIERQLEFVTNNKKPIHFFLNHFAKEQNASSSIYKMCTKVDAELKSYRRTLVQFQKRPVKDPNKNMGYINKMLGLQKKEPLYKGVAILARVLHQEDKKAKETQEIKTEIRVRKTVHHYVLYFKSLDLSQLTSETMNQGKEACLALQELQLAFPYKFLDSMAEMPDIPSIIPTAAGFKAITVWAREKMNYLSLLKEMSKQKLFDFTDLKSAINQIIQFLTLLLPDADDANEFTKNIRKILLNNFAMIGNICDSISLEKCLNEVGLQFHTTNKKMLVEDSNGLLTLPLVETLSQGLTTLFDLSKLKITCQMTDIYTPSLAPRYDYDPVDGFRVLSDWARKETLFYKEEVNKNQRELVLVRAKR